MGWGVGDSYIEAQWDQGGQQALGGVSLLLGVFASADTSHCWAHPRGFLLLTEHPSVLGSARCARRVPSWVHTEARDIRLQPWVLNLGATDLWGR